MLCTQAGSHLVVVHLLRPKAERQGLQSSMAGLQEVEGVTQRLYCIQFGTRSVNRCQ
jgi:hypothetical protein